MILKKWLPNNPKAEVIQIEPGEKPALWKRFVSRGTPTIVLMDKGTGIPVTLVGLARENQLDQGLGILRDAIEKVSESKRRK